MQYVLNKFFAWEEKEREDIQIGQKGRLLGGRKESRLASLKQNPFFKDVGSIS